MSRRDPAIHRHSPERLRWFAKRFSEMADRHRGQAKELDDKAARYLKRAEKLERS